jgi:hypothetical protein
MKPIINLLAMKKIAPGSVHILVNGWIEKLLDKWMVSNFALELWLFPSTLQSSLPDTSIEGSFCEKSTLQARFSCSSYSIMLW